MKINAAYYELRYIEIEDEYRMVLYTNNKGLELGIPYLDGNIKLAFFAFNKVEIKEKSLLTSNINYVNDDVEYIAYFDAYESRNFFFDINYRLDYLYVDNDYFITEGNHDLLVVTEETSSLINANSNGFKEHSFIANGEMIKSNSLTAYKTEILLLILLSFIPLFFSTFALRNMYSYYISKNKDEIQINYIFYKSQKKNISSCFWELFIMTSIPSTLALLMVYLINGAPSFWAFIVALLIILLFEMITIRKNTVKEVMRHCANNGWREI